MAPYTTVICYHILWEIIIYGPIQSSYMETESKLNVKGKWEMAISFRSYIIPSHIAPYRWPLKVNSMSKCQKKMGEGHIFLLIYYTITYCPLQSYLLISFYYGRLQSSYMASESKLGLPC